MCLSWLRGYGHLRRSTKSNDTLDVQCLPKLVFKSYNLAPNYAGKKFNNPTIYASLALSELSLFDGYPLHT